MVDPRIYRALLVLVAFAVIVFGFSLQNQARGTASSLTPAPAFASTFQTMTSLARNDPAPKPGGPEDIRLAAYVSTAFENVRANGGQAFKVSSEQFTARTAAGTQVLTNVIATRAGLGNGDVVVVAHRDAAGGSGQANMSGTAVLLSLAQALSGETLNRSVTLISTSGQVGAAGAAQIAQSLSGQPVDAVLLLGDLASARHSNPVVVPWSDGDELAPVRLRNTVAAYVKQDAGIAVSDSGLGGQFVRLAFPFSLTEQAPFIDAGLPAVLLSVSGDNPGSNAGRLAPASQLAGLGAAVLQTVNSLDQGSPMPSPSSYLTINGKFVPLWAVRLLVLALIIPVAVTAVDALARTRRRGHSMLRWVAWVLCGSVPFVLGVGGLLLARVTGLFSAVPPGPVGDGAVALTGGDAAVLIGLALIMLLTFVFVRPLCLRAVAAALGSAGPDRRHPESPAADAAAVALTLVMSTLAVLIWALNPYSALLVVPALHLWLWLAQPGLRAHRWAVLVFTLAAVLPMVIVLIYYANAYALTPVGLVWSVALMVSGGAMSVVTALCWALTLGCLASAIVIALRSVKASASALDPVVTVRGPASYAGPGSLGGTESALRR